MCSNTRNSGTTLVSIARSKPTGFQPVSFEPPDSRENGRDDGVQAKRARGLRFEGSHDLVHEVPKENTTGEDSRACARSDTSDLHGAGSGDRAGRGLARSCSPASGSATDSGAGKVGAVH